MQPKDADEMTNSVDPDQTAPLGAVWSESALFAQTHLSQVKVFMALNQFLQRKKNILCQNFVLFGACYTLRQTACSGLYVEC